MTRDSPDGSVALGTEADLIRRPAAPRGTRGTSAGGPAQTSPGSAPAPAAAARIARRCSGCGAVIEHGEDDGAVLCGYCGLRLAIGADEGIPSYGIAVCGHSEPWLVHAKRALRAAGLRVRALEPPRALLLPFHRLRARVAQWYREPHPAGWEEDHGPHPDVPAEAHFRLGTWDATIDAAPSCGLGPRNLGFRTQVLPWSPLADLLSPKGPGGEEHAVLPAEMDAVPAGEQLHERLRETWSRAEDRASDEAMFVTDAAQQLMYSPVLLCPFRGALGRALLVVDGITFESRRLLVGDELARFEALETAARALRPDVLPHGALVPLLCPACSGPIPLVPRARVHYCTVCDRFWMARGGRLVAVPCTRLEATAQTGDGTPPILLPFYRARSLDREWFVPAINGRSPRAAWNFALALARRPRCWNEEELAAAATTGIAVGHEQATEGSRPGQPPIAGVDVTPESARALLPFAARCLDAGDPGPIEVELVAITLHPQGRDLVERGSGLGLPRDALTPWESPARPTPIDAA